MRNRRVTSWITWVLIAICLAQSVYIYTLNPRRPAPDRIVSTTPVGKGGAIYEVEYNSGGATVPLVYRYFLIALQPSEKEALQKISLATPFLITQASHAVNEVSGNHVKLLTEALIYNYHNTAYFKIDEALNVVTFELNATLR